MRPLQTPPKIDNITDSSPLPQELLSAVTSPVVKGKYLHWDKLRRKIVPDGVHDSKEWWRAIKYHRQVQRKLIPLNDVKGSPFSYSLVDSIYEKHVRIDAHARDLMSVSNRYGETDITKHYLVQSLSEEAITSSQMEGASTTRDVAREMILNQRDARNTDERMILNNYRTMEFVCDIQDEPLTPELILELHARISKHTLNDENRSGRYRESADRIVVQDTLTGEILHTPPKAETLEAQMAALCAFANGTEPGYFVHPVIRSIVIHFWLAYVHPFVDGNGRVARALYYWSMLHHGYWLFRYVSISRILKMEQRKYSDAFLCTESDDNDLNYFITHQLDVMERAMQDLLKHVERTADQSAQLGRELERLAEFNPRQRALLERALRHPDQPYSIKGHQKTHDVAYASARSDLLTLAELGLVRQYKVGRAMHFVPVADLREKLRTSN